MSWEWLEEARQKVVEIWDKFKEWLSGAVKEAYDARFAIGRGIADGLTALGQAFIGALSWFWSGLNTLGSWLWQGFKWVGEQFYNAFYTFGEWLSSIASWVVNQLASWFTDTYNNVRDAFAEWASTAQDWYLGVINTFIDKMERIVLADMTLIGMWKGIQRFAETGRFRYLIAAFTSPFVAALASGVVGKVMKGSAEVKPIPKGTPIWPIWTGVSVSYQPTEPGPSEYKQEKVPGPEVSESMTYIISMRTSAAYQEGMSYNIEIRPPKSISEQLSYDVSISTA